MFQRKESIYRLKHIFGLKEAELLNNELISTHGKELVSVQQLASIYLQR